MNRYYFHRSGEVPAIDTLNAFEGLPRGVEAVWYSGSDNLPAASDGIVVGSVEPVFFARRRWGLPTPPWDDYPEPLRPFLGRRMWRTTVEEVMRPNAWPVFIKSPRGKMTLRRGVVMAEDDDRWNLMHLDDDEPLLASEVVRFVSEWRVFLNREGFAGMKPYAGDPFTAPDRATVEAMIAAWDNRPWGCGMDVGVLDDGRTVLVECNPGYALGSYDLGSRTYLGLLRDWWEWAEAEWRRMMPTPDEIEIARRIVETLE
jgi:hypothetical protein